MVGVQRSTLLLAAGALVVARITLPSTASAVPTVPDAASELIACSEAHLLRSLGILTVPESEIRGDRPIAVLRDTHGNTLWSQWTPVGQETSIASGDAAPGSPAPLIELVEPAEPGCWMWSRDPNLVILVAPDGKTSRGVFSDPAIEQGLQLEGPAIALTGPPPVQAAPRSTWQPQAVSRFLTDRSPVSPPDERDGVLAPNSMVQAVLATCPEWRPGVTFGVGGNTLALFCPVESPRAWFDTLVEQHRAAKSIVTVQGGTALIEGALSLLPSIVVQPSGLVFTNSTSLAAELTSGDGEPWWDPDEPTSGVTQKTQEVSLHLLRAEGHTRANMLFTKPFTLMLWGITPKPVNQLVVPAGSGTP